MSDVQIRPFDPKLHEAYGAVNALLSVLVRPRLSAVKRGYVIIRLTKEVEGFLRCLGFEVQSSRRRLARVSEAVYRQLVLFGIVGPMLTRERLYRSPSCFEKGSLYQHNSDADENSYVAYYHNDLLAAGPLARTLFPIARDLMEALRRTRSPRKRQDLLNRLRAEVVIPWNEKVAAWLTLPRLCEFCGRPLFRLSRQRTRDDDLEPRWCSATCRSRYNRVYCATIENDERTNRC